MSWYGNLRVGTKFNLLMSLLLIVLFVVAALLTYKRQQALIIRVATDNARSIARQIIETRDYMSGVVREEPEHNYGLVPQVVATNVARKITAGSKYSVRQVSLRYRNPNNRPDAFETAQLQAFAATPEPRETWQVVDFKNEGALFRYMLPMKAEKSCLGCHGSYETAPRFVQLRFPPGHYSYNYKLGEVIGAVSVTIPMSDLNREIGTSLKIDLFYRAIIFLVVIAFLGMLIRTSIINPLEMLSATFTRVTKTGNFSERLPKTSNDEIGQLIQAFNAMMVELEHKTEQSREAEDRYRKFIEMARSPVVTFMEDGKIIISNQKAERLFGQARHELLGENIFAFFIEREKFEDGITTYLRTGMGGGVGQATRWLLRNIHGREFEVEMALTVSQANHNRMFTAILREQHGKV